MTEQTQVALYQGVNIEQITEQGQVPHLKIYY